jgi:hypothetical protein
MMIFSGLVRHYRPQQGMTRFLHGTDLTALDTGE